jgi:hypothetical protein
MEVDPSEFGTEAAPEDLETHGLGPCIGVAIIYKQRGFLLHSPHVIVERISVVDPFLASLKTRIPERERRRIRPLLAGGSSQGIFGEKGDPEVLECRREIARLLVDIGFPNLREIWAGHFEVHDLYLDLTKQIIRLGTRDTLEDDRTEKTFPNM